MLQVSAIARWSYQLKATIWPLTGFDDFTQSATYGEPYTVHCNIIGKQIKKVDVNGQEFITQNRFFTEMRSTDTGLILPKANRRDRIAIGEVSDMALSEEIRLVSYLPTDALGDPIPDWELAT